MRRWSTHNNVFVGSPKTRTDCRPPFLCVTFAVFGFCALAPRAVSIWVTVCGSLWGPGTVEFKKCHAFDDCKPILRHSRLQGLDW